MNIGLLMQKKLKITMSQNVTEQKQHCRVIRAMFMQTILSLQS